MMDKPLASLCVPFYNQEAFVQDTIEGALSQTYENLEIILSDDCSTDHTFERIQAVVRDYTGPHKIIINRNDRNIGLVAHNDKIIFELASGNYIFLNGGDDVSMPNRVKLGMSYFLEDATLSAVTFSRTIIDKNGKEKKKILVKEKTRHKLTDVSYLTSPSFMSGAAALSFRKDKLSVFGRLSPNCQTEDSVLRFRSLLVGDIISLPEIGLKYRVHDTNISRYIYRLATEPIAEQYKKDLELVKARFSESLFDVLERKIEFYIQFRNLQKAESQANMFSRQILRYKRYRISKKYSHSLSSLIEKL